jgi:hypothetical protein
LHPDKSEGFFGSIASLVSKDETSSDEEENFDAPQVNADVLKVLSAHTSGTTSPVNAGLTEDGQKPLLLASSAAIFGDKYNIKHVSKLLLTQRNEILSRIASPSSSAGSNSKSFFDNSSDDFNQLTWKDGKNALMDDEDVKNEVRDEFGHLRNRNGGLLRTDSFQTSSKSSSLNNSRLPSRQLSLKAGNSNNKPS